MTNAITLSQEILNAHPDGVRSLFLRYGINTEATPRTIILGTREFGQKFIDELATLYPHRNFTGRPVIGHSSGNRFIGEEGSSDIYYSPMQEALLMQEESSVQAPVEQKSTFLDNFTNIFNKAAGIVTTGVNVVNAVKTGTTSQTTANKLANMQVLTQQQQLALEEQRAASRQKVVQYVIVGVILVIIIVAAVLIFKKKK